MWFILQYAHENLAFLFHSIAQNEPITAQQCCDSALWLAHFEQSSARETPGFRVRTVELKILESNQYDNYQRDDT